MGFALNLRASKGVLAAGVAIALAAWPVDARAAALLEEGTVSAAGTLDRSCFGEDLSASPAVDSRSLTIPGSGLLQARLEGDESANWDLAVLERGTGRVIAASAQRGSSELAEGFVIGGADALIQACRRSGDGDARLTVESIDLPPNEAIGTPQLVRVETPTRADKELLQSLDLDLTEHGGDGFLSVVAYGGTDLAILNSNGFEYDVEIPDLAQSSIQDRQEDRQFSRAVRSSAARASIPSGRTTYRRLFNYQEEMQQLAQDHPDLVKPLTLPHETWEGRQVEGIEITTDAASVQDGKPVYLQMGVHHAREWPSGEHVMEYAHELIDGYLANDPRITQLVQGTRTILIPVVNPDGFNVSREAGQIAGAEAGRHANNANEQIAQIVGIAYEYWRKNCRLPGDPEAGQCLGQPASSGLAHGGVDPNRNYGGLWGGPGASTVPLDQDYRGPGPFSEPETQNVRDLVSSRQVTTLITNHTFSNLWLRPPGQAVSPDSPDETVYHALGQEITAENGYSNIKGYELYDTTGTTEDWSYWTTGGLGFTPEIGCTEKAGHECRFGDFHGPYADHVVSEYDGSTPLTPVGGQGNREAYLIAHENALNTDRHSLIEGEAPAGAVLRVQKTFQTDTWEGEHGSFQDHLESAMTVPPSGQFDFHVNPSTRPIVELEAGREPNGDPSPAVAFSGGLTTAPDGAIPCADFETETSTCFNDHAFVVPPNQPGLVDNARITVRIDWITPATDWDLRVFSDSNGDGSSAGETEVAQSGQGTTNFEEASLSEPNLPPGNYVARVINFAAVEPYDGVVTFSGPTRIEPGAPEAWSLTCEIGGNVQTGQQVFIARGESAQLDLRQACERQADGGQPGQQGQPGNANQATCKKLKKKRGKAKGSAKKKKKRKCKRKRKKRR